MTGMEQLPPIGELNTGELAGQELDSPESRINREEIKSESEEYVQRFINKVIDGDEEFYKDKAEEVERIKAEMVSIRNRAIDDGLLNYDQDGSFINAMAPNGEISNLDEQDWILVRTKNFLSFFGEWEHRDQHPAEPASEVVDENGEPNIVWHATRFSFDEFSHDFQGTGSGTMENTSKAFYFIEYAPAADEFKGTIFRNPSDYARHSYLELKNNEREEDEFIGIYGQDAYDQVIETFENNPKRSGMFYPTGKTMPFFLSIKEPNLMDLNTFTRTWHNKEKFEKIRKGDGIMALPEKSAQQLYDEKLEEYTRRVAEAKNEKDESDLMFLSKPRNPEYYMDEQTSATYVVYEPNQIKSTKNIMFSTSDNKFLH